MRDEELARMMREHGYDVTDGPIGQPVHPGMEYGHHMEPGMMRGDGGHVVPGQEAHTQHDEGRGMYERQPLGWASPGPYLPGAIEQGLGADMPAYPWSGDGPRVQYQLAMAVSAIFTPWGYGGKTLDEALDRIWHRRRALERGLPVHPPPPAVTGGSVDVPDAVEPRPATPVDRLAWKMADAERVREELAFLIGMARITSTGLEIDDLMDRWVSCDLSTANLIKDLAGRARKGAEALASAALDAANRPGEGAWYVHLQRAKERLLALIDHYVSGILFYLKYKAKERRQR